MTITFTAPLPYYGAAPNDNTGDTLRDGFIKSDNAIIEIRTTLNTLSMPYDLAFFIPGVITANLSLIGGFVSIRTVTLPAGLTLGARAQCRVAPLTSQVLNISHNGSTVGNITFAGNSTIGSFIFLSNVTVSSGDTVYLVSPASLDSTMADTFVTIAGLAPIVFNG